MQSLQRMVSQRDSAIPRMFILFSSGAPERATKSQTSSGRSPYDVLPADTKDVIKDVHWCHKQWKG